jgi:hypothetical protein
MSMLFVLRAFLLKSLQFCHMLTGKHTVVQSKLFHRLPASRSSKRLSLYPLSPAFHTPETSHHTYSHFPYTIDPLPRTHICTFTHPFRRTTTHPNIHTQNSHPHATQAMAPKTDTTTFGGTFAPLTEREQRMLFAAITHCNKNAVEVDYQKFADAFGLKNAASARTGWSQIRKKIEAVVGAKKKDAAAGKLLIARLKNCHSSCFLLVPCLRNAKKLLANLLFSRGYSRL